MTTIVWCSCPEPCRDPEAMGSACASLSGIWLRPDLFRADLVEAFVAHPASGAIATFTGLTRDRDDDGAVVQYLHYEAYTALVLRQLRTICAAIRERWAVGRIAIQHRLGDVGVGQASVRIAIASRHRADALASVAFAIDQLKAQAAIFKRQHYCKDGLSATSWIENRRPPVLGE